MNIELLKQSQLREQYMNNKNYKREIRKILNLQYASKGSMSILDIKDLLIKKLVPEEYIKQTANGIIYTIYI